MFTIGQAVIIGLEDGSQLTGTITRIWGHGDVTVKVPGAIAGTFRTFVRQASQVAAA